MEYFQELINNYPNEIKYWDNFAAFKRLSTKERLETISNYWSEIISNFFPENLVNEQIYWSEYRWVPVYKDIYKFVTKEQRCLDEVEKPNCDLKLMELFETLEPTSLKTYIVDEITKTKTEYRFHEYVRCVISRIKNNTVKEQITRYKKIYSVGYNYEFKTYLKENDKKLKQIYENEETNKYYKKVTINEEEKRKFNFFFEIYDTENQKKYYCGDILNNLEKYYEYCPDIFKYLLIYDSKKFINFISDLKVYVLFQVICETNPDVNDIFNSLFHFDENCNQTLNQLIKKYKTMYDISCITEKRPSNNAQNVIQKKIDNWKFESLSEFMYFFESLNKTYLKHELNLKNAKNQIFELTDNPILLLDQDLFILKDIGANITDYHVRNYLITTKNLETLLRYIFQLSLDHTRSIETYSVFFASWLNIMMEKYPQKLNDFCFDLMKENLNCTSFEKVEKIFSFNIISKTLERISEFKIDSNIQFVLNICKKYNMQSYINLLQLPIYMKNVINLGQTVFNDSITYNCFTEFFKFISTTPLSLTALIEIMKKSQEYERIAFVGKIKKNWTFAEDVYTFLHLFPPLKHLLPKEEKNEETDDAETQNKSETKSQCNICLETQKQPKKLKCNHTFCWECIKEWYEHGENKDCPLCRETIQSLIYETKSLFLIDMQ